MVLTVMSNASKSVACYWNQFSRAENRVST